MKKGKKLVSFLVNFYTISITIVFLATSCYLFVASSDLKKPELVKNPEIYASEIYDINGNVIQKVGKSQGQIKYEELPQSLLNAIVAIEDTTFFYHDGVDIHRVFGSIFHNIFSSNIQGASTITQQLARNLFLTSDKTFERKIKELLLSLSLESEYDKKEILEMYFNRVNFDPVYPGICYASSKFFNKKVQDLSLVESATLAGLVQSPSAIEPFKHPEKTNARKNLVISRMKNLNLISENEYILAINTHVEDILYQKNISEDTLPYQAYIDAVYEETYKLTGLDPYSDQLKIYTYMEPTAQIIADEIQNGNIVNFSDEIVQIGAALIKNESGQVAAIIGGRNYNGRRLFNRAYDKKVMPASTIKPVFEYLLAVEKLDYHRAKTLLDEETFYLNGTPLKNAGNNYVGKITFQDAFGYSKNTTAINALNELTKKYGENYLEDYLNNIGLMDEGPYTESYGLGGMTEGISLINLAASYRMIAKDGTYIKPSLISKICTHDGKILYENKNKESKIVNEETSNIIREMLLYNVDNGYNGLDQIKLNGIKVGGKTGTGQYPLSICKKYGFPINCDKDSLVVGFTEEYSLAVWSGFDKPEENKKSYFYKGDNRKKISKNIFKEMMKKLANKKSFAESNNLFHTNVVKFADDLYYPNDLIPKEYQMMTTLPNYKDIEIYPLPIEYSPQGVLFEYDDRYIIKMSNELINDEVYKKIYGNIGYHVSYNDKKFFTTENEIVIYKDENIDNIKIKIGYEELITSEKELVFDFQNYFDDFFI